MEMLMIPCAFACACTRNEVHAQIYVHACMYISVTFTHPCISLPYNDPLHHSLLNFRQLIPPQTSKPDIPKHTPTPHPMLLMLEVMKRPCVTDQSFEKVQLINEMLYIWHEGPFITKWFYTFHSFAVEKQPPPPTVVYSMEMERYYY